MSKVNSFLSWHEMIMNIRIDSFLWRMYCIGVLCLIPFGPAFAEDPDLDAIYLKAQALGRKTLIREALNTLNEAVPSSADSTLLLARIGHLYLRLQLPDSAETAFERSLKNDPHQAESHLGLGRVLLEYRNKLKRATSHLKQAIQADANRAENYEVLGRTHLARGKEKDATEAANKALQINPRYGPAHLLLARLYRKKGDIPQALSHYNTYLSHGAQDETPALEFALEFLTEKRYNIVTEIASRMTDARRLPLLAQVLLASRRYEDALSLFQKYLDTLSQREKAIYEDIFLIATPEEIASYRAIPDEDRDAFLNAFWIRKDPFGATGGSQRRAEHYRRVWHARTFFGRYKYPFDQRGEIYIRYGEPDYRSTWREPNARVPIPVQRIQEKLAFQLYGRPGTTLTYTGPVFPIRIALRNVESNLPLEEDDGTLGLRGWKPVTAGNDFSSVPWEVWIYPDINHGIEVVFTDEMHSNIFGYAPVPTIDREDAYDVASRASPLRFLQLMNDFSPASQVAAAASKKPERYDTSDLDPLNFYYEALSFRGKNGKTDLQINIGLPIDEVAMSSDPDTTVVVERRIALVDDQNREAKRLREDVAIPLPPGLRGKSLIARDRIDIPLSPGEYDLAVQMWRVGTNRLGNYREKVRLHDFSGDSLMLSDLQIAQHIEEPASSNESQSDTTTARSKWRITTSPSRTFFLGTPIFVYFEIYNLTRDTFGQTRYEVAFAVAPEKGRELASQPRIRRRDGELITVQYEQTGRELWTADYVELDIGRVEPGRYRLIMTVKDLNSTQATVREGIFKIGKR